MTKWHVHHDEGGCTRSVTGLAVTRREFGNRVQSDKCRTCERLVSRLPNRLAFHVLTFGADHAAFHRLADADSYARLLAATPADQVAVAYAGGNGLQSNRQGSQSRDVLIRYNGSDERQHASGEPMSNDAFLAMVKASLN